MYIANANFMKTYTIIPADKKIKRLAHALWIVNQFRTKGFDTREKFMEKVLKELPELNTYQHTRKLSLFWLLRNVDYVEELDELAKRL